MPAAKELTEQDKNEQFDVALKGFLSSIDPGEKRFWSDKYPTPERSVAFQSALLNLVAVVRFWPEKIDVEVAQNTKKEIMSRLPILRREAFFQTGKPGMAEINFPLLVDRLQKDIESRTRETKSGKRVLTVYGEVSRMTH